MSTTAVRATDLVDTFGVNTHIPYTDGEYSNIGRVEQDLAYLGIDKIRDNVTNGEYGSATLSSYIALAKQGVQFSFVLENSDDTPALVDARLNLMKAVDQAVPGSVVAAEGWNEVNNFGGSWQGLTGEAAAEAAQAYLYKAVKSDPTLSKIAVDYFTGYTPGSTDPSTTPGLADYDNQHSYPNGQAPAFYEETSTTLVNETTPGPFKYTETGYSTNVEAGGVSAHDQGAYSLDLLLDAAKDGSAETDIYELLNAYAPGTPNGDSDLGLFDYQNNPTLAAQGIHNLTALLKDDGADAGTFTTTPVGYTLSGTTPSTNSMEIQKSDGTTDIAVWAEPGTGTTPAATPTTVALQGKYDVSVFDPLTGTAAIATYSDVSSVTVGITDHPLIVQLTKSTDTGSASTPPSTTSPTGGTDTGSTGTPPSTTSPTGGTDTGSTGTPPSTTSPTGGMDTGSTPVTTDPGTGSTPPVTTAPTTPAAPAIDVGALTSEVTTSVLDGLHAKAVARFELREENFLGGHFAGPRGDLAGTALVEALPAGTSYAATLHMLKGLDAGADAKHGLGYWAHALGEDPAAVKQVFTASLAAAHQGAVS